MHRLVSKIQQLLRIALLEPFEASPEFVLHVFCEIGSLIGIKVLTTFACQTLLCSPQFDCGDSKEMKDGCLPVLSHFSTSINNQIGPNY